MNRIFALHFSLYFFTSFFTSFCIISYILYESLPAPAPPNAAAAAAASPAAAAANHGLIVYAEMYVYLIFSLHFVTALNLF